MTSPAPKSAPIAAPPLVSAVTPEHVATGVLVAPLTRVEYMSPKEWEEFVLEWAHCLKGKYQNVERCAGAGDQGRDVIGNVGDAAGTWDNYQCKRYGKVLAPNDIWVELGKLCYYTFINAYTVPRAYYFAAPKGLGPSLSSLLKKPAELKQGLIKNWDEHCKKKNGITSTQEIPLDGALLTWVQGFDFSIFHGLTTLRMIDQHRETPYHVYRFGGGLPPRPPIKQPPLDIQANEQRYIQELFGAYADDMKCKVDCADDLEGDDKIKDHFSRSRVHFYSAESLRNFSRDTLPTGQFEILQDSIYDSVIDTANDTYETAYKRVLATTREAKLLPITAHSLSTRLEPQDKMGICHQLVNDNRLRWIQ